MPRAKRAAKPSSKPPSNKSDVTVKNGKPFMEVTFKRIKSFVTLFVLLFFVISVLSLYLLVTAVKIRSHLGSFINMISSGAGEVLPSLLAVPTFLVLCVNIALFVFVYKIFSNNQNPAANNILFILIIVALAMIVLTLMAIFGALGHVFGTNKNIENGILQAMEKYSVNSLYKRQIDSLQIEFQCCGSRKYDDWFNVSWLDKDLSTKKNTTQCGSTPFSCCNVRTKFPCIHFDIEIVGVNYLYTPEFNLSVSTIGCQDRVVERKRQVGLGIVAGLFLFIFLEILLLIPTRFLQTAHSVDYKFEGNSKNYLVWLIGSYSGKNQSNGPPEPPPVPPELRD